MIKKKLLVIIIILLLLLSLLSFLLFYINKSAFETIIGKNYSAPMVSMATSDMEKINVSAGEYRYGDVNQDGEIDKYDKMMIELMINSNLSYNDSHKSLADFNQDGKVDETDLTELNDFISNKSVSKYKVESNKIEYCLSEVNDYNNCHWQKDSVFLTKEEKKYYIFVKENEKISPVFVYEHKLIDREKTLPHKDLVEKLKEN